MSQSSKSLPLGDRSLIPSYTPWQNLYRDNTWAAAYKSSMKARPLVAAPSLVVR